MEDCGRGSGFAGPVVIIPSQAVKIVVATKPVDFRKGHDGLAAVVQNELGLDPHSGIVVVFRAKRGDPLPGNTCLHV